MNLPQTHWIETDFYGLLGMPLQKSMSPFMHNSHFQSLGMNALYHPYEVSAEQLDSVFSALAPLRFRGLNVTMLLKQSVLPYLDSLDEMGMLCNSVNTIGIRDNKITGTSTDGSGLLRAIREQGQYEPSGKSCALFGSGGAARSIAFALVAAGVSRLYLLDRPESREMLQALVSDLNAYKSGICTGFINDETSVRQALGESQFAVNATCAGMSPHAGTTPFDTKLLRSDHFVADIVYIPRRTQLLVQAEAQGCQTLEGQWMFIWQGVEAFEFWTGQKANVEVMIDAVLNSLR